MIRKALSLTLSLGLATLPAGVLAQAPATDAEVLKGIAQVEEGDYDAAIFTLDTAARRLTGDPAHTGDLSQAYLYLGIAYFGKGHEAAAKANFRDAILQFRDISLSAEEYPPKIINLFEAAREEAASTPAPAAAPPPQEKKGGSKMPLVLIGVGGAAAAGIAVAAGGGGDSEPEETIRTQNFSGTLDLNEWCRNYTIIVNGSGTLEAELTWDDGALNIGLGLYDSAQMEGEPLVYSDRVSDNSARLQHPVSPSNYVLELCHWDSECTAHHDQNPDALCPAVFSLTVRHP